MRNIKLKVRLTKKEDAQIVKSASVRKVTVTEFMRSAALGRKAYADYNADAVMALRDVIEEMRVTCRWIVEHGITPAQLESVLQPIVDNAITAMTRISR